MAGTLWHLWLPYPPILHPLSRQPHRDCTGTSREARRRTSSPGFNGAYLRFSKSTGFSTVAEDRGEGALVASQPRSRYASIAEPEPSSLPTTSGPPSGPLQAYYWPTSSQLVGNHSDVDPIHIGVVAYLLARPRLGPSLSQAGSGPARHCRRRRPRRTAIGPKWSG
jgi:hypothetical protein